MQKDSIDYRIEGGKTILVIGDSLTEAGVDDGILASAFNLSRSAEAYFYSYLKVKAVLKHNPQIETVVLSYSPMALAKGRDNWSNGTLQIGDSLQRFLPLFGPGDIYALFVSNPYGFVASVPRALRKGIEDLVDAARSDSSTRNLTCFGHFRPRSIRARAQNNVDGARKRSLAKRGKRLAADKEESEFQSSQYQEKYLQEIYGLVRARNKNLILINLPRHPSCVDPLKAQEEHYWQFARTRLPDAIVLDHSDWALPGDHFDDMIHLNQRGAKLCSEFLKKTALLPR